MVEMLVPFPKRIYVVDSAPSACGMCVLQYNFGDLVEYIIREPFLYPYIIAIVTCALFVATYTFTDQSIMFDRIEQTRLCIRGQGEPPDLSDPSWLTLLEECLTSLCFYSKGHMFTLMCK